MAIVEMSVERGRAFAVSPAQTTLLYVLKGTLTLTVGEVTQTLKALDFSVINAADTPRFGRTVSTCAVYRIDNARLLELTNHRRRYFVCNSVEGGENYEHTRAMLDALIIDRHEVSLGALLFERHSAELLLDLVTHYANNTYYEKDEASRRDQIEAFLWAHYRDDLSLGTVAAEFGLTPQYFSRMFKEEFGETFLRHLAHMRLDVAERGLADGDRTIAQVAMDVGFRNVGAFATAFKERHDVAPHEWRARNARVTSARRLPDDVALQSLRERQQDGDARRERVALDVSKELEPLVPLWSELWNFGPVSTLLAGECMQQAQSVHERVHVKMARIVYDGELSVDAGLGMTSRALDFLIDRRITPMVSFNLLAAEEGFSAFDFMRRLILTFLNRYGSLDGWVFELACGDLSGSVSAARYAACVAEVRRAVDDCGAAVTLAGPFALLDGGGENLARLLGAAPRLDLVTLAVAPYRVERPQAGGFLHRLTDADYIRGQVSRARRIAGDLPVRVTSWQPLASGICPLYDSRYYAAEVVRSVIDCYGLVEALPLFQPLDPGDVQGSSRALYGSASIIAPGDIKKPAFYAYDFLQRTDKFMLGRSDHVLATCDSARYLQLVCHNCKRLGPRFYEWESKGEFPDDLSGCFEDGERLEIDVEVGGVPNGVYLVKHRFINGEHGDSHDIYLGMNYRSESFFGAGERRYLRASSMPGIEAQEVRVHDGRLVFSVSLEPNEVRHIHVLPIRI